MSHSKLFLLELCVLKSLCLALTHIKIHVNAHAGLHFYRHLGLYLAQHTILNGLWYYDLSHKPRVTFCDVFLFKVWR